jgi:phosphoribosylformimino-5-aminoimidazole carboxamide ribonucleotide (ProFAR) isomerase
LSDLDELARLPGLGGIITGRAVYEGVFGVAEALGALRAAVDTGDS